MAMTKAEAEGIASRFLRDYPGDQRTIQEGQHYGTEKTVS